MLQKRERQALIRELLARNLISNQDQLQDLLATEQVETTQATLSRDLRDLGAVKGPKGYFIPDGDPFDEPELSDLQQILQDVVLSVDRGANLIILRTKTGHASSLAIELDRAQLAGVLGSISGVDTVFVATQSNARAGQLLRLVRRLIGRRRSKAAG